MSTDAGSTPTPDPAAIRAEVAALDATPFAAGESNDDRRAKRDAIYQKPYPPAPTPPESSVPPADFVDPLEFDKGSGLNGETTLTWGTHEEVEDLYRGAESAGIPRHAVSELRVAIRDAARSGEKRWTRAEFMEYARQRHGEAVMQDWMVLAADVFSMLKPHQQKALLEQRLLYDPRVQERMRDISINHLRQARTPQGEAFLRDTYQRGSR